MQNVYDMYMMGAIGAVALFVLVLGGVTLITRGR